MQCYCRVLSCLQTSLLLVIVQKAIYIYFNYDAEAYAVSNARTLRTYLPNFSVSRSL